MKLRILLLSLLMGLLTYAKAQSVVDIIVNSPDHNTLETAVLAAGLQGVLSGEGPFTVFAPTDEAFASLPEGTIEALLSDPQGILTDILLYHVAGVNALSTDLSDDQIIMTLNGSNIIVTINETGVFINDARVIVKDITANNGVVHVINAVLLPPVVTNTVVDIIVNSPDHNTLETAVLAAGLQGVLSGEGPFTVFAPTDEAFASLPEGTIEALLADPQGILTDILLYHVMDDSLSSEDFIAFQKFPYYETLNGKTVTVRATEDGIIINDVRISVADIKADNGIVHVINAVLLPPDSTIIDVVRGTGVHTILEIALDSAGFSDPLSGYGPFTLFAPTDAAFSALPEGTIEALLSDPDGLLSDILTFHLAEGSVLADDLMDGQFLKTLSGKNVRVTFNQNAVFINDAQVIITDVRAENGVVHVIDAVLLPYSSVVDIINDSEDHFILSLALNLACLDETLNGEGPFTVFAPTDDAFVSLPEGTIEALIADPEGLLKDILLYHVAGDRLLSTDLSDGQIITSLSGKDVMIRINEEGVFINNAKVTVVNLEADNGVVHVIDAVLIRNEEPTTVWDIISDSPVHNILETAISAAGLESALKGEGPFTVFAPTDDAFDALPDGTLEALLNDASGLLTQILLYHVVEARALSSELSNGQNFVTLNGQNITVSINTQGVFINNAQVIIKDIIADNGVVHVIDAVLSPPASTDQYLFGASVELKPNPANQFLNINFEAVANQVYNAEIISISGKNILRHNNVESGQNLDISGLDSGLYYLRIFSGSQFLVKSFIKI